MNGGTEMDVREKLIELLTNSQQLDVLDWATGWEEAAKSVESCELVER